MPCTNCGVFLPMSIVLVLRTIVLTNTSNTFYNKDRLQSSNSVPKITLQLARLRSKRFQRAKSPVFSCFWPREKKEVGGGEQSQEGVLRGSFFHFNLSPAVHIMSNVCFIHSYSFIPYPCNVESKASIGELVDRTRFA